MFYSMADGQRWERQNSGATRTLLICGVPMTLRATGGQTGGVFALVEATVPPYFNGFGVHVHQTTTEAFYIVQGTLAFTLDEETSVVRQGSLTFVPPGKPHRFWNPSAAPATYLTYMTPAGAELYFEALAGLLDGQEQWPPTDMEPINTLGQVYDHYASLA